MLASQLIYTGCGKDKTGAFSVWSKSQDITKNEETEIQRMMLYKRPGDLPYEPTEEELNTVFPRKFGYFNLSSGRVCIAQSAYIGNVYSDLDQRTGNYIIHAFVFDKTSSIIPMKFLGSEIFKRSLTYKEWHDDGAPEFLPQIEIEQADTNISKADSDSFFTAERLEYLKLLIQAISNAASNDQRITFYDKHQNLKYWYNAICTLTPKALQSELTFNTFFTPGAPIPGMQQGMTASVDTEVKIRNISAKVLASVFSYKNEAQSGNYAFDFVSGITPEGLTVSRYVDKIVTVYQKDLFQMLKMIAQINDIAEKCTTDLDSALDIYNILNNNIAEIDSIPLLESLTDTVKKFYLQKAVAVADAVYAYGFETGKWAKNSSLLKLYRFVFDYSETADKSKLVAGYINGLEAFGTSDALSAPEYYTSAKENAPFLWSNFVDYILEGDNLGDYKSRYQGNLNRCYLVFNTFSANFADVISDESVKNKALVFMLELINKSMKANNIESLILYLRALDKCGEKWAPWMVDKSISVICGDKRLTDSLDASFLFSFAERVENEKIAMKIISTLVSENMTDMSFVKTYIDRTNSNIGFYSVINKKLAADEKYSKFIKCVKIQKFKEKTSVSEQELVAFYSEFCENKGCAEIFADKLGVFLSSLSGQELIKKAFTAYDSWIKKNSDGESSVMYLGELAGAFESLSTEDIKKCADNGDFPKFKAITDEFLKNGFDVPAGLKVVEFGEEMKSVLNTFKKAGKVKSKADEERLTELGEQKLNELLSGKFYTFYRNAGDKKLMDSFISGYFDVALDYFLLFADVDSNFIKVFDAIFEPMHTSSAFKDTFLIAIDNLDKDGLVAVFTTLIVKTSKGSDGYCAALSEIIEVTLKNMQKKNRKKFFEVLVDETPKSQKKTVEAFVNKYQKDHEGFMDKILGIFKKSDKKEKEDDGDEDDSDDKDVKHDKKDKKDKEDKDEDED